MSTRNILITIFLLILFAVGFFIGVRVRQNDYNETRAFFQSQLNDLQKDLQTAEFINRKLAAVFNTVEETNADIHKKAELIQQKEKEIEELNHQLTSETNSTNIKRILAEIQVKNIELNTLRNQFDNLSRNAIQAQKELAFANKMLKEKNDILAELSKKTNNIDKGEMPQLKQQITKLKQQIQNYEEASKFEYQADNYKGANRRKNRDKNLHNAYYYYKMANSKTDMARVYDKIQSKEIKQKIDNGVNLNTDSDISKELNANTYSNEKDYE